MESSSRVFGHTEIDIILDVNFRYIWERTKGKGKNKEKNFIHNFATVYAHESMHREIHKVLFELWRNKEEEIVGDLYGYEMLRLDD